MAVTAPIKKISRKAQLRLPPEVQTALDHFQTRLVELFPGELSQLILFGSYARGDATPESDIDILVVMKWNEGRFPDGKFLTWYGDPRWNQIIDIASDVLLEHGIYISPLVMSETRFSASDEQVLRAAQREGKLLWKTRET